MSKEEANQRYDFLALTNDDRLVIVEIKRSGHPVSFDELYRLDKYRENLTRGTEKNIYMLLVCGGKLDLTDSVKDMWEKREDGEIAVWGHLYDRAVRYYSHYKAVLEGDITNPDFDAKKRELAKTRSILETGTSYRGQQGRRGGLGSQDVNHLETPKPEPEVVTSLPQDED